MQALPCIFFEVEPGDADFFLAALDVDLDESMLGEGFVVLRNLVALGQVGIEIILPCEYGSLVDAALQGHRRQSREFDGLAIQHGQGAGESQTHRADIRVGRISEACGAGAKNLRDSQQLDVDLKPDDRLVLGEDSVRDGWSGRHKVRL